MRGFPSLVRGRVLVGIGGVLVGAAVTLAGADNGSEITACVNRSSGELKLAVSGQCPQGSDLLQWNKHGEPGPTGPPGPAGPAGLSGSLNLQYYTQGMYPNTSVSRAFCPTGTTVVGGGGISVAGAGLQQNYPISDESGVIAFGSTAIGWQVAASDWSDVQAFVICAGP